MTYRVTAAEDYKVASYDSGVNVTFTSVNGASTTDYPIAGADGAELTARELPQGEGRWQLGDKRWWLARARITEASHYPKPGDHLTDGEGVIWEILDSTQDELGAEFMVTTRRRR